MYSYRGLREQSKLELLGLGRGHLASFGIVEQLVALIRFHGTANNKTRALWSLSIVKVEGEPGLTVPFE